MIRIMCRAIEQTVHSQLMSNTYIDRWHNAKCIMTVTIVFLLSLFCNGNIYKIVVFYAIELVYSASKHIGFIYKYKNRS